MGLQINGKRMFLRIIKLCDVESLIQITNDESVIYFSSLPYPFTLKDARNIVNESKISFNNGSSYTFGIFLKENKELIGVIRLTNINQTNKNADVGYWIGKNYRGNGFCKESLNIVLDFGFKKLKLVRISAKIMHLNTASIKLVEKLGFKQEGRMRKAVLKNDEWIDGLIYGLLKEDYKQEVMTQKLPCLTACRENVHEATLI